jgi:transposase
MNSKLHAVTDAAGRPLRMFLTAGQRSDYIGARALLDGLPPANHMLADRGYDADWYREALEDKGITPCIPSRKNRKVPIPYDEARYRKRHKIENSFARLKDWRRVYPPLRPSWRGSNAWHWAGSPARSSQSPSNGSPWEAAALARAASCRA